MFVWKSLRRGVQTCISDSLPANPHSSQPGLSRLHHGTDSEGPLSIVMTKLFGTDGMRGEAGVFPLDSATVETVGTSLASHLKNKLGRAPLIVIGRDTRESGGWLEQALVAGAAKAGARLELAGVITTPGVAFLTRTLPADAGIVISASHNAYSDNGVKIFAASGRKLDEETERLIEGDVFAE